MNGLLTGLHTYVEKQLSEDFLLRERLRKALEDVYLLGSVMLALVDRIHEHAPQLLAQTTREAIP